MENTHLNESLSFPISSNLLSPTLSIIACNCACMHVEKIEALFFLQFKKCFSTLPFDVVWDHYSLKLQGKQYKQNTSPKSYKTEIKILANPGLA